MVIGPAMPWLELRKAATREVLEDRSPADTDQITLFQDRPPFPNEPEASITRSDWQSPPPNVTIRKFTVGFKGFSGAFATMLDAAVKGFWSQLELLWPPLEQAARIAPEDTLISRDGSNNDSLLLSKLEHKPEPQNESDTHEADTQVQEV
jgi:hypothetical protein